MGGIPQGSGSLHGSHAGNPIYSSTNLGASFHRSPSHHSAGSHDIGGPDVFSSMGHTTMGHQTTHNAPPYGGSTGSLGHQSRGSPRSSHGGDSRKHKSRDRAWET